MKRFVYNPKYAKLLVHMSERTSQIDELAKTINANSGHLRIVLDQWSKEGIIKKDKPGRDYQITLTAKGEAISLLLGQLMVLDDHWEQVEKAREENEANEEAEGPADPEGPEEHEAPVDPAGPEEESTTTPEGIPGTPGGN